MGREFLSYWPLILAAVGYIAWLARLESKVVEHDKRITYFEDEKDEVDSTVKQMALDIREMKTDIKWIKENR